MTLINPNPRSDGTVQDYFEDKYKFPHIELEIQKRLKKDVENRIKDNLTKFDSSLTEEERQTIANAFINGDETVSDNYRFGLMPVRIDYHPSVVNNEHLR